MWLLGWLGWEPVLVLGNTWTLPLGVPMYF